MVAATMTNEDIDGPLTNSSQHALVVNPTDDVAFPQRNRQRGSFPYLRSADFVELLSCIFFSVFLMLFFEFIPPQRERPIPVQQVDGSDIINLTLSEDMNETVSDRVLIIICVFFPLIIQLTLSKVIHVKGDAHATLCVYFLAFGLTVSVTEAIKDYCGYLRPSFYSLCEPNNDYQECTGSKAEESRKSFPSGHASVSFCGMTLLSLYLQRRFGVYSIMNVEENENGDTLIRYRKSKRIGRACSILCSLPVFLALWIAVSRVADNAHFPADVLAGSFLGLSFACFSHGLWFPTLAVRTTVT